jgi:2'-5' RNA ligase
MGVDRGILNAMQEQRERMDEPHFILRADSPAHPAKNIRGLSHDEAVKHLRGAGYEAFTLNGMEDGKPVREIVVFGVTPIHAEDLHYLASCMGQESSVYSDGKSHEMRFHHGEKEGTKVLGEGTEWYKAIPESSYRSLAGGQDHFSHLFGSRRPDTQSVAKSLTKKENNGVTESYKEEARNHCDFLFRVKINGRHKLAEEIPLHMSVKIFRDMDEFDMNEVEKVIEELDIKKPDPHKVRFEPIIFYSKKSDADYFMLKLHDCDPCYEEFYNKYKDKGVTYEEFMPHITINEELYNTIKESGLDPEDISFSDLTLENGADNPVRVFDGSMHKGIKSTIAALGIASALGATPAKIAPEPKMPKPAAQASSQYSRKQMLNTIAHIESANGKLQHHKPTKQGTAYGKYGLMPDTIRETIRGNKDLRLKYGKATALDNKALQNYMRDNPGLEDTLADRHVQRLEHHFGQNPQKIGYAWNQGITGTYHSDPKKIGGHPYTKKVTAFYPKGK